MKTLSYRHNIVNQPLCIHVYFTDRTAVIISDGSPHVSANGSIYLVNSSGITEGLLPSLPRSVDNVTVTWLANRSQVYTCI